MLTGHHSFAGRLPELSADLNRKLGGPVAASPPKPKKATDHNMKAPPRPGTAARRPTASKSLVKVLEDDSQKRKASRTRPGDVLARMRSATPAAVPGIKREASEPLGMDRIPRADNALKEMSRNVLSRSMSSTSVADLKAQKKAEEARQIEEAISGIRKPNRSLIGRAIFEDAAKRTGSSSSSHPKKQRKPIRNAAAAAASRIQVKATPANYRFKDAVGGNPRSYASFNAPPPRKAPDLDAIPSSSTVIPDTLPRNSFRNHIGDHLDAFHVASTPAGARKATAQTAKYVPSENCIPESSPIMARRTAPAPPRNSLSVSGAAGGDLALSSPVLPRIFETPVKRRTAALPQIFEDENISSTPPEPRSKLIFATPAKKTLSSVPVVESPLEPEPPAQNSHGIASGNLYQQMGWEDDFDTLFK